MFGFVRPLEGKLTEEQLQEFKSYYCGVCKSIEKRYTHLARFTLTYDCAFLAMFLSAFLGSDTAKEDAVCVMRKRQIAKSSIVDYCADINVLLAYYKFDDDVNDDDSKKAKIARATLKKSFTKAKEKNPHIEQLIKSNLEYLYLLEKDKCSEPDRVADAFGRLLEGIVGYGCNMNKEAMAVGYNLGRFIYLLDAFVDYQKDIKNDSYNVFVLQYGVIDNLKEEISFLMECILSEMIKHYNLMDIKYNKEIIDNVLYLGIISPLINCKESENDKDKDTNQEGMDK